MKYARIIVDIPVAQVDRVYDYIIPEELREKIRVGMAVKVPFGSRTVNGFVVVISDKTKYAEKKLKKIIKPVKNEIFFDKKMLKLFIWMANYYKSYLIKVIKTAIPTGVVSGRVKKSQKSYYRLARNSKQIKQYIQKKEKKAPSQVKVLQILLRETNINFTAPRLAELAGTYPGTVYTLRDKGLLENYTQKIKRKPLIDKQFSQKVPLNLTKEQKGALNDIKEVIYNNNFDVFLLHGVTGSGKTEVYLQAVEILLQKNKGAIILVPEISLTHIMVKRFYSRFGNKIAVLHSNLSDGERYDEWRRLQNGKAKIAIGARSAVFAPVDNLGLIIIDEEHETSYKQSEYPYYHARRVAIARAKINKFPVVLGSATPSVESFYKAEKNKYKYLSLSRRIKREKLPPVEIVDMREELKQGNTGIFSNKLKKTIQKALADKRQVLLFLNRRGYASFVLCRECGYVIKCKNCDITLTYHARENILRCHYCDYKTSIPEYCPQCGSKYIKNFGTGTEKIEAEVKKIFPGASVDRMDIDTTSRKDSHYRILKRLEKGETDILVGTQMIAKGHDYPNISVVGVISADTILNLPDFRSSERTFQLLTQVAGRTGRGEIPGKVIIQTYTPENFSIRASKNHDYIDFYKREIKLREKLNYPPFVSLVNIILKGEREEIVSREARRLGRYLSNRASILGPSPAPIKKLRGKYRWQIILKFKSRKNRNELLKQLAAKINNKNNKSVNISINVDPVSML